MPETTQPAISLTRQPVPVQSIATAMQHALTDLPDDLPDGLHFQAKATTLNGQHGAEIGVVLKVSDSVNGQVRYTRSYDASGAPQSGWSIGVQGTIKF